MPRDFDAIVIGTGQSGPALARRMAGEGWKVAVVERDRPGGTCVNTGCIPTKALVASARVAALARRAGEHGVAVGGVRVDFKHVKERMRAISARSREGVRRSLERAENLTFLHGHARLVAPGRVAVGDGGAASELRAPRIFLNVGARAARPDLPGLGDGPQERILDHAGLLELDELPAHLVVVGGSYVGLELAQVHRRFGSEVTILQRGPRLVPREDADVAEALREILEAEGIAVRTGAECLRVERRGDAVVAHVGCAEGAPEVLGSHLLLATGRVPNTDDLGLERAGVARAPDGTIPVDEELRTNVPGIWALGDCNGRGGFTHTSYHDYEIVEGNLFDGGGRRVSERIPAYALYTDPPLGRCGLSEREARASVREVLVGKLPMESVSRAYGMGETAGFLKILVDAESRQILGASLLGVAADEVVHVLLGLMYARAPATLLTRAVHIHPTVSEYLPTLVHGLEPLAAAGAD